ncbi:MAG: GTPase KRas precursor [Candidatus Heimdallarchaeota archaeon LC_2]|nr:MAG: GTPase KRas precursor [Candidatus Heimdallarchaeota archaeon LC_2]
MPARQILKITLLGDGAVGKTSMRTRFMGRGFTPTHLMTIGADFAAVDKTINYNGTDYHVTFQIWDLAGQARFTEVRARFYFGSLGGLCLFDITNPESFQNISNWINEIWKNSGTGAVPLILVGNKSDLRDGKSVQVKKVQEYCDQLTKNTREHGFDVIYIETSAKSGENVDKAFDALGKWILAKRASERK